MLYNIIPYDENSQFYTLYEVALGLDKLTIDDGFIQIGYSERSTEFVNVRNIRTVQDKRSFYKFDSAHDHHLISSFNIGLFP